MIDAFLQRYPLWPHALAEKFSMVLAYAMPESEKYITAKKYYENTSNQIFTQIVRPTSETSLGWNHQFSISMLKPTNDRFKRSQNIEQQYMEYPIDLAHGDGVNFSPINSSGIMRGRFRPYVHTVYDSRIFDTPSNIVRYKFTATYGPFSLTVMSIMSYIQIQAYRGYTDLIAEARATVKPFNGLESIIALHENGVTLPNVDMIQIYDFATYVIAYNNYSGELQADKNLLMQKANIAVSDYRQQLNDQAAREYSDLQSKKIQLLIAIDNEAKSAQRDFQNMLLTAQSLKTQLGNNIG